MPLGSPLPFPFLASLPHSALPLSFRHRARLVRPPPAGDHVDGGGPRGTLPAGTEEDGTTTGAARGRDATTPAASARALSTSTGATTTAGATLAAPGMSSRRGPPTGARADGGSPGESRREAVGAGVGFGEGGSGGRECPFSRGLCVGRPQVFPFASELSEKPTKNVSSTQ